MKFLGTSLSVSIFPVILINTRIANAAIFADVAADANVHHSGVVANTDRCHRGCDVNLVVSGDVVADADVHRFGVVQTR